MTSTRNTSLDGLRGVAALAVVFSHIANMSWMPGVDKRDPLIHEWFLWHFGAPAVDIFLVLSGYVIARSLINNPVSFPDYIMSRMIRLYPVAWVAVLIGMGARFLDLVPFPAMTDSIKFSEELFPRDIIGLVTMVAPIPNTAAVNPPLWTLVIEMQAAFLMPIILYFTRKNPYYSSSAAFALIVAFGLITGSAYLVYFSGFILGTLLAVMEDRIPQAPRPGALMIVSGIILLMRHYLSGYDISDPDFRIPCAIAATGLVLSIIHGAGGSFLQRPVIQWLGQISYPLYAVHWPIMAVVVMLIGKDTGITIAAMASLPLVIFIAWIVSRYVDMPAVRFAKLFKRHMQPGKDHKTT